MESRVAGAAEILLWVAEIEAHADTSLQAFSLFLPQGLNEVGGQFVCLEDTKSETFIERAVPRNVRKRRELYRFKVGAACPVDDGFDQGSA